LGKQAYFVCAGILGLAGLSFGQATISLSRTSGPPTTSLLVSGSGFSANTTVDLFFDKTQEAAISTTGSGSFSNVSIPVPPSAQPGEHEIAAKQPSNGTVAQAQFKVNTNWSQFYFAYPAGNVPHVPPDNRVNPYENVLSVSSVSGLKLKWSIPIGIIGQDVAAPVVNGVVYLAKLDLDALNASTGALLWSFPSSAYQSSPAVANGVVYFGSEDFHVYALNASTGTELWSFATGDEVFSSPAVAEGVVYVSSEDHSVYALNASTGVLLWSFATGARVFSSPAVANGVVYVGSEDHNVYALNASTGAKLWSFKAGGVVFHSLAVANGEVYVGSNDGNIYALNASNGAKLWTFATDLVTSSPAVANGVVYVGSEDHNLYALNASNGAKLWTFATGSVVNSSPAVANGVVYVGSDDDNVYALDATTGAKLWSFATGNPVDDAPTVANGAVYVSNGTTLYAFGLTGSAGPVEEPQP
jgi:outer membrane protein assembly factor BamB